MLVNTFHIFYVHISFYCSIYQYIYLKYNLALIRPDVSISAELRSAICVERKGECRECWSQISANANFCPLPEERVKGAGLGHASCFSSWVSAHLLSPSLSLLSYRLFFVFFFLLFFVFS